MQERLTTRPTVHAFIALLSPVLLASTAIAAGNGSATSIERAEQQVAQPLRNTKTAVSATPARPLDPMWSTAGLQTSESVHQAEKSMLRSLSDLKNGQIRYSQTSIPQFTLADVQRAPFAPIPRKGRATRRFLPIFAGTPDSCSVAATGPIRRSRARPSARRSNLLGSAGLAAAVARLQSTIAIEDSNSEIVEFGPPAIKRTSVGP